ncbi:hypothetical protein HHI36_013686 [Cryptolaemus montrouzieri]|uniref:SAC3/GANP/THP3 conserved domain-containing protein n=1 Tax=Cryptolaemus montrouzieri TaxID=559131 RepID=A0ABD2NI17_9CUCU
MVNELNQFITGTCETMCPLEEMKMREKEHLLHILEMVPGTEKLDRPLADPKRIVKSFNRSAAGKSLAKKSQLRPPEVLLRTVNYLLDDVIQNKNVSWTVKYNFIMDRLRSVRQDMIIQNISRAYSICLLQPIVRFYAYSAYKLCHEEIGVFDPYLNRKHLHECLNRLLVIYDETEELFQLADMKWEHLEMIKESRPHFEALYIILNLGNEVALNRVLKISRIWRTDVVQRSTYIALNYLKCNFVRVCRYMKKLPPLLAAVAALHLSEVRRKYFEIMSVAFSSKNLTFPSNTLKELLLFQSEDDIIKDCRHYGIQLEGNAIRFDKNSFNKGSTKVHDRKEYFIEEKLNNMNESCLLLVNHDVDLYVS